MKPKWKLSFCLSTPQQLLLLAATVSLYVYLVSVALADRRWRRVARRQGPPPHVEHHSHRMVVSRGAGESLSSAPTGTEPGAENWDLTVRAMTSCLALLLLLILVLIDSMFDDNIALSSFLSRLRAQRKPAFGHTPVKVLLGFIYMRC